MLRPWLRRPWLSKQKLCDCSPVFTRSYTFVENDYIILRPAKGRDDKSILVGPLTPGKYINASTGVIAHTDIIDQPSRALVKSDAKRLPSHYRMRLASLDEYIRLTKRLVTPIYPSDANLIVSLFDIHVDTPVDGASKNKQEKDINVLEAGTGHGALTLYLSRAIHAANTHAPREDAFENSEEYQSALEAWKRSRNAVINSIDCSAAISKHASSVVKGFRHGIYHGNVDFHVTDVSAWVRRALAERNEQPFLTHAFLDLPSAERHVETIAGALMADSTLIVFAPSITQIVQLLEKVKNEKLALAADSVIELGVNGGTSGREWDVRPVRLKAAQPARDDHLDADLTASEGLSGDADMAEHGDTTKSGENGQESIDGPEWSLVCRPKVGGRIMGGGFLAVFKKPRTAPNQGRIEADVRTKIAGLSTYM